MQRKGERWFMWDGEEKKSNTLLFKIYTGYMIWMEHGDMTCRITPVGSWIQTMEWVCETYMHDDKGWRGWVFLDDIYHNTTKQQINARSRVSLERWRRSVAFPVSSYTHKLHTVRRSPVQICFIAASVRVSACAFFRSAIGLVFKRTVEFHVRH